MTDSVSLAITTLTLGQILFCLTALMLRPHLRWLRLPLAVFFLACALIIAGPLVVVFIPMFQVQALVLALPAALLIAPALYFYVDGVTTETPWTLRRQDILHAIPAILALICAGLIFALPQQTLDQVFMNENLGGSAYLGVLFTVVFCLVIFIAVQSGAYLLKIFQKLNLYRGRVKETFANLEGRDLVWIYVLMSFLAAIWVLVSLGIIAENLGVKPLIDRRVASFIGLALVWGIGLKSLSQVPGFEGQHTKKIDDTARTSKYERSALQDEQARRIAQKIERAMSHAELYLDPNLSLAKLADHIGTSPNHVSQTLNQTLKKSFFDYINHWRIEASKGKVVSGDEDVLTIALSVGFNANSSFYKAFKKETGQTPRAFRLAHKE
ncbi:MAG: AraC family transcriptional regulator [Litorimonas sp.]